MTIRAIRGSINAAYAYNLLYFVYTNMTTYGWKSVGESNGTIGGMGITGIITSATSLTSSTAWFVIRSPDYQRQLLFFRGTTGNAYMSLSYSRSSGYVGGSASTLPIAVDNMSIFAESSLGSGTIGCFLVIDDAYPYGFYFVDRREYRIFSMTPLQIIQDSDQDPYIFHTLGAGYGRMEFVKCWHPNNLTQISLGNLSSEYYFTWGGMYPFCPGGAYQGSADDAMGNIITLPSVWLSAKSSQNVFKGFSSWLKWHGNQSGYIANELLFNNAQSILINTAILPWDGQIV